MLLLMIPIFASQIAIVANNESPISEEYDFDELARSGTEGKWLSEHTDATSWFAYAASKNNLTCSANWTIDSCKYGIVWFESNDSISKALCIYCLGPARKDLEPNILDDYYTACGNALISSWAFLRSAECSISHQTRYIGWNYACSMLSAFYEIYRVPARRGRFGQFPAVAFVLSVTPFLLFIMALSALNYIIVGRVLKKSDEGPILYHRFEIACDFSTAAMCICKDLDLGVIADWLHYVFTGTCLQANDIASWQSATGVLRNICNDLGNVALALLANDKYQAITDPVEYMKAVKRPAWRLTVAGVTVVAANGFHLAGDVCSHHGWLYVHWMHLDNWEMGIGLSDSIRAAYTFACLYIVLRSSIGISRRLRNMKKTAQFRNEQRQDMLERTGALTLQTCALNGFSLLATGISALLSVPRFLLKMGGLSTEADVVLQIGTAYVFAPQYAVVICSSNIGVLVHCYYSKMYREAMRETLAAMKASFKRCAKVCGFKINPKNNVVHPDVNQSASHL